MNSHFQSVATRLDVQGRGLRFDGFVGIQRVGGAPGDRTQNEDDEQRYPQTTASIR